MTHNSSNHVIPLILGIVLSLVTSTLPSVVAVQEVAQVPRIFGGPERQLYNGVPTKLPLRFDIKNVTSEKWVHELEIEVTNTSDKPIYYMHMFLLIPGVKDPTTGYRVGFLLKYGRIQLIDFHEPLKIEDVPIKPGEKHTFKISDGDAKGWEYRREKEGRPEPRLLELEFQQINFGDGTGYITTAGKPVDIHKKISFNRSCISPRDAPHKRPLFSSDLLLPAFMPVNFFAFYSS